MPRSSSKKNAAEKNAARKKAAGKSAVRKNPDVPETCSCALLLIDVINDLEFDGGKDLFARALPMARKLSRLVQRARAERVPVIYVNDNFGHWRSDFRALVDHCLKDDVRGGPIARLLEPGPTDYFVLKPSNSAFFGTVLETLLHTLEARTLILTGMAGDNCVLFTAHDAHMRRFRLLVPSDCVASESPTSNRWALQHMRRFLRADTQPSTRMQLAHAKAVEPRKDPSKRGVTRTR